MNIREPLKTAFGDFAPTLRPACRSGRGGNTGISAPFPRALKLFCGGARAGGNLRTGFLDVPTKTKSFVIILIGLMISCQNQNKENEVPDSEQNEVVTKDTQETEIKETKIDMTKIIEQLQGKWKEIEYPYRTAEFVSSTVKFVEEGTAGNPKFEKYEISSDCQFENNNIRDLTSMDIILTLPEANRCEKLNVSSDTLILSGFSTNTNAEYRIVYLKMEEEEKG